MNYFANKQKASERAKAHTAEMESDYREEIERCVSRSEIITLTRENGVMLIPHVPTTDLKNVVVLNISTTSAILQEMRYYMDLPDLPDKEMVKNKCGTKIAVLNFASFKNPGGLFLEGSMAQEESLCHASYLYNVLSRFQESFYDENGKMLNKNLYENRGIYTPDVRFTFCDENPLNSAYTAFADVITVAAPNAGAARRLGVSEQDILVSLIQRIRLVMQILLDHGPYMSIILGAFGCGVFRNHPENVAKMFYKELDNIECQNMFHRVVFAIIGDGNISSFQRLLTDRRDSFKDKSADPLQLNSQLF